MFTPKSGGDLRGTDRKRRLRLQPNMPDVSTYQRQLATGDYVKNGHGLPLGNTQTRPPAAPHSFTMPLAHEQQALPAAPVRQLSLVRPKRYPGGSKKLSAPKPRTYVAKNAADYRYRNRMYNDSLALANFQPESKLTRMLTEVKSGIYNPPADSKIPEIYKPSTAKIVALNPVQKKQALSYMGGELEGDWDASHKIAPTKVLVADNAGTYRPPSSNLAGTKQLPLYRGYAKPRQLVLPPEKKAAIAPLSPQSVSLQVPEVTVPSTVLTERTVVPAIRKLAGRQIEESRTSPTGNPAVDRTIGRRIISAPKTKAYEATPARLRVKQKLAPVMRQGTRKLKAGK